MSNEGYIKLLRKLEKWEWYKNQNVKAAFIHCLLRANYDNQRWQKRTIKRGSFVTSISNFSSETGLSIQQTRTALEHLKSTNDIAIEATRKYSIITVVNYSKYQDDNKKVNKQSTHRQHKDKQTDNKQVTTIKERKEVYLSPTEINIREEGKNSAAPSAAEGGKGLPVKNNEAESGGGSVTENNSMDSEYRLPTVREMKIFARTIPRSTDSIACDFLDGFELSGTRMPDNWKELYERFVSADPQVRIDFVLDMKAGKYKEKWGEL